MIKEYNNGKVITDGNFSAPVAVSASRFSFPFENERSVRIIEQDYVVRSENFSKQTLGTQHPQYTDAVLVSESGFSNLIGGLVRFTRTFLSFPSYEIILPITSNVQFPAFKEYFQTGTDDDGNPIMTLTDLRTSFSRVVHCDQRIRFVNLASNIDEVAMNDSHIPFDSIQAGAIVIQLSNGKEWVVESVSSSVVSVVDPNDENTTSGFTNATRGGEWIVNDPVFNFDSISIRQKFSPVISNDWGTNGIDIVNSYTKETTNISSVSSSVDYVSSFTSPSVSSYLSYIESESKIQIEDTKIEHFLGTIYKVTNIVTKAL